MFFWMFSAQSTTTGTTTRNKRGAKNPKSSTKQNIYQDKQYWTVVVPYHFGCVINGFEDERLIRCFVPFAVSFAEGTVIAPEHWSLLDFRADTPNWSLYENPVCFHTFQTPLPVRQYDVDLGFDLKVQATLHVNSTYICMNMYNIYNQRKRLCSLKI